MIRKKASIGCDIYVNQLAPISRSAAAKTIVLRPNYACADRRTRGNRTTGQQAADETPPISLCRCLRPLLPVRMSRH